MRICWYNDGRLGLVDGDVVHDVSEILSELPPSRYPHREGDLLIANLARLRSPIRSAAARATRIPVSEVKFLSPVARPTKIIGVPVNYLKHVEEAAGDIGIVSDRYRGSIREQGLFLKACSALVGASEGITVRFPDRRTDHEMELGVVIGQRVSHVSESEALSCIAGYAIALDMVVRGPEDRSFRKSIDSYAVLGPWLVTSDEIADPQNLNFGLSINGEIRQQSNTRHMLIGIAQQIAWASSFYTLWPGDVIMTGTCEGVGQVKPGDTVDCWIDVIGRMTTTVQ